MRDKCRQLLGRRSILPASLCLFYRVFRAFLVPFRPFDFICFIRLSRWLSLFRTFVLFLSVLSVLLYVMFRWFCRSCFCFSFRFAGFISVAPVFFRRFLRFPFDVVVSSISSVFLFVGLLGLLPPVSFGRFRFVGLIGFICFALDRFVYTVSSRRFCFIGFVSQVSLVGTFRRFIIVSFVCTGSFRRCCQLRFHFDSFVSSFFCCFVSKASCISFRQSCGFHFVDFLVSR